MKRQQHHVLSDQKRPEADVSALFAEELPEFVMELASEHGAPSRF
jgi:hypothetical protein